MSIYALFRHSVDRRSLFHFVRPILAYVGAIACFGIFCVHVKNMEADLYSLVEAERAFARLSKTNGMRDAFMTFLLDEAVVFRPRPIPGKPVYAGSPNVPNMLTWKPVYADVSYEGDLGYTTGPYEYRRKSTDPLPSGTGYFISVWKKRADQPWRVLIDAGISTSLPDTAARPLVFGETCKQVRSTCTLSDRIDARKTIEEKEKQFSLSVSDSGYVYAGRLFYSDRIRLYRNAHIPVRQKSEALELLALEPVRAVSLPDTTMISDSCDMGVSYGIMQGVEEASLARTGREYSYLRIWKKETSGVWSVTLDLLLPIL